MAKWKKPLGTMIVRENTAKRMRENRKERRVSTSNAEMRQRLRQEERRRKREGAASEEKEEEEMRSSDKAANLTAPLGSKNASNHATVGSSKADKNIASSNIVRNQATAGSN